jgi:ligand-binding sensor domain-containing protein
MRACFLILISFVTFNANAQINFWNNYTTSNSGIPSDNVNWVNKSQSGDLYVGTNAGLAKFDGNNWTTYSTSNSNIPSNTIGKSRFDANGNLWFLCNGLTKFDGTTFTNYNSSNITLPAFTYNDLDIDQNGVVWLT